MSEQHEGEYPLLSQLWNQITTSDVEATIVILGHTYSVKGDLSPEVQQSIESRIWITYRTGFEPIPKCEGGPSPLSFLHSMLFNKNPIASAFSNVPGFFDNENFTSDVGWGCMIRTSQSLLANAYQLVLLGRDFVYDQEVSNTTHNAIVDAFRDSYDRPCSLHNFVKVASALPLQVKPGQWFGPNAASLSIKRICSLLDKNHPDLPKLLVLISDSSDLYENEIVDLLASSSDGLLVLLPVRLGIDRINPIYHSSLLQLLLLKQSVGIAGGRPSSSFYFFGYQDNDRLLYLDPHFPQGIKQQYESFHTTRFQTLSISDLDPSMLIGFVINDMDDYNDFKNQLAQGPNKIIHLNVRKTVRSNSESKRKPAEVSRKTSEFVTVSRDDANEEFVTVGDKENDDFIDLVDEIEADYDIVNENEENEAEESRRAVENQREEVQNMQDVQEAQETSEPTVEALSEDFSNDSTKIEGESRLSY